MFPDPRHCHNQLETGSFALPFIDEHKNLGVIKLFVKNKASSSPGPNGRSF